MALESIKTEPGPTSRVIAFNGCYASLPEAASVATTVHLVHGGEDSAIDLTYAVAAQEALIGAGGDMTLDIIEGLGHAIDNRSVQLALGHLYYTISRHYFGEALSGGEPGGDDVVEMM